MSLDLEIGEEQYNYTYNVSNMWYEIFPDDEGMVKIERMTGDEAAPRLRHAIVCLVKHSEIFRKMEPKNKWGSFNGFVAFLLVVLEACERNPTLTWRAYR